MAYGFLGVVLIVLAVASLLLAHFFFPGHFLKLKPQEPVVRDSFDPAEAGLPSGTADPSGCLLLPFRQGF
jgi:hypothetical protein